MNRLFALALSGMMVVLASTAGAADDDNAKKIVGKWEVTKAESDLPVGSTLESTQDGKLILVIKGDSIKLEGTYKVEKEKLIVKLKAGDLNIDETVTILKLTDNALEIKDKDSKTDVFKKVK